MSEKNNVRERIGKLFEKGQEIQAIARDLLNICKSEREKTLEKVEEIIRYRLDILIDAGKELKDPSVGGIILGHKEILEELEKLKKEKK